MIHKMTIYRQKPLLFPYHIKPYTPIVTKTSTIWIAVSGNGSYVVVVYMDTVFFFSKVQSIIACFKMFILN